MTGTSRYDDLSPAEREWVDGHVEHACSLGVDPQHPESISSLYDEALLAVQRGDQSPEIGNSVVNLVGALIGEYVCRTSPMRWAILTDEFGTELCVYDPATSWTFFPQSSAAKRWEAQELGWVVPFCAWVHESVTNPPPG